MEDDQPPAGANEQAAKGESAALREPSRRVRWSLRRPEFGISDLMLWVTCAGFTFAWTRSAAIADVNPGEADTTLWAVGYGFAAFWMIVGLLQQVRDLWRVRGGVPWSEPRWRKAFRFAIGWRIAVAAGLLAQPGVLPLIAWRWDDDRSLMLVNPTHLGFAALTVLLPLCVLLSTPWFAIRARPAGVASIVANMLVSFALPIWIVASLCDLLLIHGLILVALTGIELSFPLHLAVEGVDLDVGRRWAFVGWAALAAVLAIIAAGWGVFAVARSWRSSWPRRFGALLLWCVAWTPTCAFFVWMQRRGLSAICPWAAEATSGYPEGWWPYTIVVCLSLAAVFATRIVWLMTVDCSTASITWRNADRFYVHETRWVWAALIIGWSCWFAVEVLDLSSSPGTGPLATALELAETAKYVLMTPPAVPMNLLIVAAIVAICRRRRTPGGLYPCNATIVQTLMVFLLVVLTIPTAVVAFAVAGLAPWLLAW